MGFSWSMLVSEGVQRSRLPCLHSRSDALGSYEIGSVAASLGNGV